MNDRLTAVKTLTHEDAEALLPWYCNGSLSGVELSRMRVHVESCAVCRTLLDRELDLAAAVRRQSVSSPLPAMAAYRRLAERIAHDDRRRTRIGLPTVAAWLRGAKPSGWYWRFAAAAGAVLLVVPVWTSPLWHVSEFHTLSEEVRASVSTYRVRVVLRAAGDTARWSEGLAALGAKVVEGPSARGVYTVEVGDQDRVDQVVTLLRALPDVLMAEPVNGPANVN